jgi:nucleotide-binding universal stress UspA family protein
MTAISTRTDPRRTSAATSQDGPVLLAAKPMGTLGAPFAAAHWLAAREDRELRVVTVLQPPAPIPESAYIAQLPPEYLEEERAGIARQLRDELKCHGMTVDVPQIDVLEGYTLEPIMDCARAHRARVVVVGSGRHERFGRTVYGERALRILGIADRPVIVVPQSGIAASLDVAVVATDFSPASVRAARAVLPMLSHGGRLIVVHVKTSATLNEETAGWWNDAYERDSADHLAQFVRQLPELPGITVETKFLRGGDAAGTVIAYAASRDAKMIACGRLGHSLLQRVIVGSVSAALVRQSTCPVLVAPELHGDTDAAGRIR